MASDLVALTDAMVSALQAAPTAGRLSMECDVKRVYDKDFELEKVKDYTQGGSVMVRLSPEDEPDQEAATQIRGVLALDYRIQFLVVAKCPDIANESVDPVLDLLQELRDYFFKQDDAYRPTGRTQNTYKIETASFFDRQRLIDSNLIVSTFFLTSKEIRRR